MEAKNEADWERLAGVVGEEDPFGHLNSIHNCRPFYDYTQAVDHPLQHPAGRRLPHRGEHRRRGGSGGASPIVIDECGYEGDIDQGWGNITGEEMVRRCWEGAVRGGYVGHGETYLDDAEELWWSKGGELAGTSPERIAFLHRVIRESPTGVFDPLPSDWDAPRGGVRARANSSTSASTAHGSGTSACPPTGATRST